MHTAPIAEGSNKINKRHHSLEGTSATAGTHELKNEHVPQILTTKATEIFPVKVPGSRRHPHNPWQKPGLATAELGERRTDRISNRQRDEEQEDRVITEKRNMVDFVIAPQKPKGGYGNCTA